MDKRNIAIITSDEERYIEELINAGFPVSLILTNKLDSPAIETAEKYGVKYEVIDHREFSDRKEHDREIMRKLTERDIDLVVLAGYKRLISDKKFFKVYGEKMINIHNSFLPNFPGANPHEEVFLSGIKKSGYTIHYVDEVMDRGEIIYQEEIDIKECESAQEVYDKLVLFGSKGLIKVVKGFLTPLEHLKQDKGSL